MLFFGMDTGKDGAFGCVDEKCKFIEAMQNEVVKTRGKRRMQPLPSVVRVLNYAIKADTVVFTIENTFGRRGEGVSTAHDFGETKGI